MRVRYSIKPIISLALLLLLLCSFLLPTVHASTPNKILGQNFYFHRDLSGIEGYRVLDAINPTKKDNNSISQNIPIGIYEVGDGWISPAVPRDINLTRGYNFLFSVWGAGNGNATLFFKFYAYRNNNEHLLFTSNPSEQLIINATEMLWQHKTKEVTLEIKAEDRLVLRLFINATVAGRFGLGYDCTQYSSYVYDPTETRYLRSDEVTVNSVRYYKLGISQTASPKMFESFYPLSRTAYWGMRVWKKASNGTTTEITSGTPVAQVSRSVDGYGIQSVTWACPQTALDATDRIVVCVYQKIVVSGSWLPVSTPNSGWVTEELGATQLDSTNWTIYYYTERDYDTIEKVTYADFYWGTSTFISRIENFSWTAVVSKAWYDVSSWTASLVTRMWSIGMSFSLNLLARQNVTVASWLFDLGTRIWVDVATWTSDLVTMAWQNISWIFYLGTSIWTDIATWGASLVAMMWNDVATYTFNLLSMAWHDLTWLFTLLPALPEWVNVALWTLILQPQSRSGLLLICIAIGIILSLGFVRLLAVRKRKTTQTTAEMLYRLSYRIRK
jgi:hypothetical protein